VLDDPKAFSAEDVVPGPLAHVPPAAWRAARLLIPTFIWVGAKSPRQPAGPALATPPRRLAGGPVAPTNGSHGS
jgi:hypothetical protein